MTYSLLDGNEAIALGALKAGCRFFAGYPITPATSIFSTMLKMLPPNGGICVQGEDEIASIGMCLGASMAGLKVMSATSGPGISLFSENISFAIGGEIPIVIADVQRLGPSTGSATRGADSDIQFMRWGSSSGLPVVVLAPSDPKDCYLLTLHAFNIAERFRCPVFIASNKEVGLTRESVDIDALIEPPVDYRTEADPEEPFLPFDVRPGKLVPDFLPIGGKTLVRQTSSTHGKNGYITTDNAEISEVQDRLKKKLESHVEGFTFYEAFHETDAETMIITYGVSARAAWAAFRRRKSENKPISLLILKTLWPVPEKRIRQLTKSVKKILVVEMNTGQYVREIERVLPDKTIDFAGRMDGGLVTPQHILEALNHD